jgi:hypothetical protein
MQELSTLLDQAAERHDAIQAGMRTSLASAPHSRLLTFFVDVPPPAVPCAVRVRITPPRVPGHLPPHLAAQSWDEGMQRCIADAVAALDGAPGDEAAGLQNREARDYSRSPGIATASPLYAAARRSPRSRAATHARPATAPRPAPAVLSLSTKRLFFGHGLTPEDESSIIQRLERLLPQLSESIVAELVQSLGPPRCVSSPSNRGINAQPVHPPIIVGGAGNVSEGSENFRRVVRLEQDFDRAQLERAFEIAIRAGSMPSPNPDSDAAGREPRSSGVNGGGVNGGSVNGGGVNGGGVNGVRLRSAAEDAVRTAERVRSILGCDAVVLTGVDAATALAASRALLADAARMREVLDRRWVGLTLHIQPAGGVASDTASGVVGKPASNVVRHKASGVTGQPADDIAIGHTGGGGVGHSRASEDSVLGTSRAHMAGEEKAAAGGQTPQACARTPEAAAHKQAGGAQEQVAGARMQAAGSQIPEAGTQTPTAAAETPTRAHELCDLVDGANGGAQLLLSGTEGAAAAAAFTHTQIHRLRLAQERFHLVDEMCTRLGCKAATPLGIGGPAADTQVASLRALLGQMRARHVRSPPAVPGVHLLIGEAAAAAAACARRDSAADCYVTMPNLFDLEALEAALRVQTGATSGGRGTRARRRRNQVDKHIGPGLGCGFCFSL